MDEKLLIKSTGNIYFDGTIPFSRLIAYITCVLLAIIYARTNISIVGYFNILIICMMLFRGSESENFTLIFGLQLLQNIIVMPVGSSKYSFMFLVYGVLFFKYFLKKTRKRTSLISILMIFVLIIIEITHIFSYTGANFGSAILYMMTLVYFYKIMNSNHFSINYWELLVFFCISIISICIINALFELDLYGRTLDLSLYVEPVRFGSAYMSLAGANGIAFQTSFATALCYIFLLKTNMLLRKLFCLLFIIAFIFLGVMTVSRGFYIEIALLFVLIVISSLNGKGKSLVTLFVVIGVFAITYYFLQDRFVDTINSVSNRFARGSTERDKLFGSSLTLLSNNVYIFLIGKGIFYPNLVYFTAHNLYLDSFLSFGIVGAVCYYFVIVKAWLVSKTADYKFELLNYIPLIMLLSFNYISGSVKDIFLYYYLVFCIIMSRSSERGRSIE